MWRQLIGHPETAPERAWASVHIRSSTENHAIFTSEPAGAPACPSVSAPKRALSHLWKSAEEKFDATDPKRPRFLCNISWGTKHRCPGRNYEPYLFIAIVDWHARRRAGAARDRTPLLSRRRDLRQRTSLDAASRRPGAHKPADGVAHSSFSSLQSKS
jgi:hypothetical protein